MALFFTILAPGLAPAEARLIRVGFPAVPGKHNVRPDGAHEALMVDSLNEIAKYTNWRYEYVTGTEQELLAMLSDGRIDLIGGIYYRESLTDELRYPHFITGNTYALLVATQDDLTIQKNDYQSMQGKRIAVPASGDETKRLLSYLALNNVQGTIVYAESVSASLEMLSGGEVDMALVGANEGYGYRTISRFVTEPYYFAASRATGEDLITAIDSAYSMILDANADFVDMLYLRHFEAATPYTLTLTRAERTAISENPVLRIAIADNFPPMQSFQDGSAQGISIGILSLIAERAGISFEYVRAATIQESFDMVASGEADAVLGMSLTDAIAAENELVMTSGFMQVYRVAISSKYVEYPNETQTLVIVPGSEYLRDTFTRDVLYADSFIECVEMVNSGQADYTYGSTYFVEYGLQNRALSNIQTVTLPSTYDFQSIALRRPADPALLNVLNKAINSITSGEYQDIVLQNTALRVYPQSVESLIHAYPVVAVSILAALTLLIIIVTLVFTLLRSRHSRALFRSQYTDELTGALNLAGFRRTATRLLQSNVKYALTYSAVRNFNYINERYGYEEGDKVLGRLADVIRSDIQEDETFCRVSGSTFAALRVYETNDQLLARLDALQRHLESITPQADPGYHLSIRTGIYLRDMRPGGEHPDVFGMLDRASAACQLIKPSANIAYRVYEQGMLDGVLHNQEIERRMENALAREHFLVYLQPKYDLSTLKPCGAEALVRWQDDGRIIPPGEFIPQFERNGFIAKLDRYVFAQCCRLLRRWIDQGMPYLPVSINVSRVQLFAPDFVQSYIAIKQQYGIPDGLLDLEFTESIIYEDVERLISIVRALHTNGFLCSIDDFGKGYSSLTMLKNIPADIIKLDAQFFDSGIDKQRDTIIIESVIDIAKSLGMHSIAEGIENRHQVRMLQMIGCDMAQGYVFSRPLAIDQFEKYLRHKMVLGEDPYAPIPDDA